MSSTTEVRAAVATDSDREALGWKMWIPCIGMALCSWLSFVDRQVLAVLSPTILRETGMSAQDYGNVVFCFFIAYTLANPLWGSILDFVGLRVGMLAAVLIWSGASASHALMGSFMGFAVARALLGLGEGATFPGGLRTAVESLPANKRGRGIATSFSGGTIGAIVTPLIMVPFALTYGWRSAFILTGLLGVGWLVFWFIFGRPPYLPKVEHAAKKVTWINPFERRFWALVASYALPALAVGPIQALVPLYLVRGLGLTQADVGRIFWVPMVAWGIGYFFWGWAADKYAGTNPRPVGLFAILTVFALAFGFTTWTTSVGIAIAIISWAAFIGGGFMMVALKVGSFAYPRDQAAMMTGIASGSWSLANAIIAPIMGRMFDQQRFGEAFWMVAVLPVVGVVAWAILSRTQKQPA
jgi:MFS transporter, ACS family, hexuronate transporter